MDKLKKILANFLYKVKNPTRRFLVILGVLSLSFIVLAIALVACGGSQESSKEEPVVTTETATTSVTTTAPETTLATTATTTTATSEQTTESPATTTEVPSTTAPAPVVTQPPAQPTQAPPRPTEPPVQPTQAPPVVTDPPPPPPTQPPPVVTEPPQMYDFDLNALADYGTSVGYLRTRVTDTPGVLFVMPNDSGYHLLLELVGGVLRATTMQTDGFCPSVGNRGVASNTDEAKAIILNFYNEHF